MQKHEQKTCPHCQSIFECKTGSIEQCQCQTVSLDEAQLDYIHARYDDCLCAACLAELRTESNLQTHQILLAALLGR
jgi:hypothetical protein